MHFCDVSSSDLGGGYLPPHRVVPLPVDKATVRLVPLEWCLLTTAAAFLHAGGRIVSTGLTFCTLCVVISSHLWVVLAWGRGRGNSGWGDSWGYPPCRYSICSCSNLRSRRHVIWLKYPFLYTAGHLFSVRGFMNEKHSLFSLFSIHGVLLVKTFVLRKYGLGHFFSAVMQTQKAFIDIGLTPFKYQCFQSSLSLFQSSMNYWLVTSIHLSPSPCIPIFFSAYDNYSITTTKSSYSIKKHLTLVKTNSIWTKLA